MTVVRESGDYTLVRVAGELDHASAGSLVTQAELLIARGQRHLRFDLSRVVFFDAGGVRAVLSAAAVAHDVGGTMTLVDPGPRVARILEIVGLMSLVESRNATADSALARPSAAERRLRILARLTDLPADDTAVERLGEVCAEMTQTAGAGIMLMAGDAPQVPLAMTNAAGELIERLQYELGEGPCVDAHKLGRPVLEPDLATPAELRWPAFRGPVLDAGVRAVFGFPLRVGAVKLGALDLHYFSPGPLSDEQHATALVMADVAAEVVLAMQAGAPPGQLAVELEAGVDSYLVVHQATGMVAVQLDVGVAQAMVRLRAHAFVHDQTIHDVGRQVVDRVLRFDDRELEDRAQ